MIGVKRTSAWRFVTSSTGGVGVEFVVAEGGTLYFQYPAGKDVTFRYGAAGGGIGAYLGGLYRRATGPPGWKYGPNCRVFPTAAKQNSPPSGEPLEFWW